MPPLAIVKAKEVIVFSVGCPGCGDEKIYRDGTSVALHGSYLQCPRCKTNFKVVTR